MIKSRETHLIKELISNLNIIKKTKDSHMEIEKEDVIQKTSWMELIKQNISKIKMKLSEKSKIVEILRNENFTEEEKEELISILCKLSIDDLIELLGEDFKRHTNNYTI